MATRQQIADPLNVAAIVPVYNRPVLVLDALRSIAAQTQPPRLAVIVDDGSTDDTAVSVERWIASTAAPTAFRLIRQPNGGVSAARNRAAAEAGLVDCLAFLDSDDVWPADHLERMAATLAANPHAVAASCDTCLKSENPPGRRLFSAERLAGPATPALFDHVCPSPSSTVVRAAPFRACGGFDADYRYIEDLDFFLRLSLRGPWAYTPGPPVVCARGAQAREPTAPHLSTHEGTAEYVATEIRVLGRFLDDCGGRAAVPSFRRRRRLAGLWHSLGKLRVAAGDRAEARACFRRAVAQFPLSYRSLARLLRTLP